MATLNVRGIRQRIGVLLALALALAIAGPAPSQAQSQTGAVRGTVLDATANVGVAGAQVFVAGTVTGTLTDANGAYFLSGVPAGEQFVTVRLIGYRESSKRVTVTAGETVTAAQGNVDDDDGPPCDNRISG